MFKNMKDSGVIRRDRLEGDRESLILIIPSEPDRSGSAFLMDEFVHIGFDLLDMTDPDDPEAMDIIIQLHKSFPRYHDYNTFKKRDCEA